MRKRYIVMEHRIDMIDIPFVSVRMNKREAQKEYKRRCKESSVFERVMLLTIEETHEKKAKVNLNYKSQERY